MVRQDFVKLAAIGVLGLSTASHAEILTIDGLTPAGSPDFATVGTIAIDQFGGSDGQELAFELEDVLSGVSVFDQAYFDVIGGRSSVDPDATLTGTATTGIDRYETVESRRRCVARDKDKKCTEHKNIKVDCLKRVIDFRAQVRASSYEDGRRIYSRSLPEKQEQTICFGDDEEFSSSESEIRKMVGNAARAIRSDLAPRQYRSNIRVLESRKGMDKAERKFFKAAVKMTKSDQTEACRMWDEAAMNGQVHISLIFNWGLCAERSGDLEVALDRYQQAQVLSPKKYEVRQAIDRVNDHLRALEEWNARQSALSPESATEQG